MTDKPNFYRDEVFRQLTRQIEDLHQAFEKHLESEDSRMEKIQQDLTYIRNKVLYMYGFAAGVGIVSSFIVSWFKSKF